MDLGKYCKEIAGGNKIMEKLKIEIFWEQGKKKDIEKSKKKIWKWLQKFSNHLGITSMVRSENYK